MVFERTINHLRRRSPLSILECRNTNAAVLPINVRMEDLR
jgi:hypothetical protein